MPDVKVKDDQENEITVSIVSDEEIEFAIEKHRNKVTVTVHRKIPDEDLPF